MKITWKYTTCGKYVLCIPLDKNTCGIFKPFLYMLNINYSKRAPKRLWIIKKSSVFCGKINFYFETHGSALINPEVPRALSSRHLTRVKQWDRLTPVISEAFLAVFVHLDLKCLLNLSYVPVAWSEETTRVSLLQKSDRIIRETLKSPRKWSRWQRYEFICINHRRYCTCIIGCEPARYKNVFNCFEDCLTTVCNS